ncbi:HPr kinase/phosphorylase [Roseivivax halodurans]|uniref:HPr kinase/phosphorylase n=1 Tax=Roseivivax halodurans TaxID=93683 RepID=UPI0004B08528|nr:HPr kinase/phosphatase C-terminal domain-containing protein [Roseivivax halodurans]
MAGPLILHATAVAIGTRGALIRGPSGSGKSALALEMMAAGAALVSDDRVILEDGPDGIALTAPGAIRGLIEARGMGILHADVTDKALLCVVVDLSREETARLPDPKEVCVLSRQVPLIHKMAQPHFAAALVQYLKGGRKE